MFMYKKKKKKFKVFSKKKGLLIYLSSIKTELAINFLKNLLYTAKNRAGAERVRLVKKLYECQMFDSGRLREKIGIIYLEIYIEATRAIYDKKDRSFNC